MAKIQVLLADDSGEFRRILRDFLDKEPDIHVVAEAPDGRQAIRLARRLKPDVVLMDVAMPVLDGIQATRELHRLLPGIGVIGLSVHGDRCFVEAMLEAGASGYVLKDEVFPSLVRSIHSVSCLGAGAGEAAV